MTGSVPLDHAVDHPEQQPRRSTDTRGVLLPQRAKSSGAAQQVPLRDPLPKVDSILIDQERRLAIIDGIVAAVGDRVGPRVIVQIERDAVVLREPSGLIVRGPTRSRQVSSRDREHQPTVITFLVWRPLRTAEIARRIDEPVAKDPTSA